MPKINSKRSTLFHLDLLVEWGHVQQAKCGSIEGCAIALAAKDSPAVTYAQVETPPDTPARLIIARGGVKHRFYLGMEALTIACMNDRAQLTEDMFPKRLQLTSDGKPKKARTIEQRRKEAAVTRERRALGLLAPKAPAKENPRKVLAASLYGRHTTAT